MVFMYMYVCVYVWVCARVRSVSLCRCESKSNREEKHLTITAPLPHPLYCTSSQTHTHTHVHACRSSSRITLVSCLCVCKRQVGFVHQLKQSRQTFLHWRIRDRISSKILKDAARCAEINPCACAMLHACPWLTCCHKTCNMDSCSRQHASKIAPSRVKLATYWQHNFVSNALKINGSVSPFL